MIYLPSRRSIRLRDYDYSQAGAYYVTICTHNRECTFGEVVDGVVRLSEIGKIVEQCWQSIPEHFRNVELDEHIVMSNHLHGTLVVDDDSENIFTDFDLYPSAKHAPGTKHGSLPAIMQNYKSVSSRRVNKLFFIDGRKLWQRDYFEHVIRNEEDLDLIREYIVNNPLQWDLDEYHTL